MERAIKGEREKREREKIAADLPDFPELHKTIDAYEEKADEESLFVWTVDKMQAIIFGMMDNWRPYIELEVTYEAFVAKYEDMITVCSPYLREIFSALFEYSRSVYYDQPNHNL